MKLTWDNFDTLCMKLSQQIRQSGKQYSGVAGMPRGGLTLAVTLSHKLNLPYFSINAAPKDCLVVDDINDTGGTMKWMTEQGFDTAVLVTRYSSPVQTTFSGDTIHSDEWVDFPWEGQFEEIVMRSVIKEKFNAIH